MARIVAPGVCEGVPSSASAIRVAILLHMLNSLSSSVLRAARDATATLRRFTIAVSDREFASFREPTETVTRIFLRFEFTHTDSNFSAESPTIL
jgi:hypothetical protein